jgi:hypothetical protein
MAPNIARRARTAKRSGLRQVGHGRAGGCPAFAGGGNSAVSTVSVSKPDFTSVQFAAGIISGAAQGSLRLMAKHTEREIFGKVTTHTFRLCIQRWLSAWCACACLADTASHLVIRRSNATIDRFRSQYGLSATNISHFFIIVRR